jgi:hypothetical protein
MIPREVLRTDAGRAAVTQAWIDGYPQKRIARECFGYSGPAPITVVISEFISTYAPDEWEAGSEQRLTKMQPPFGEPRRRIAPLAIARFIAARDAVDRAAAA